MRSSTIKRLEGREPGLKRVYGWPPEARVMVMTHQPFTTPSTLSMGSTLMTCAALRARPSGVADSRASSVPCTTCDELLSPGCTRAVRYSSERPCGGHHRSRTTSEISLSNTLGSFYEKSPDNFGLRHFQLFIFFSRDFTSISSHNKFVAALRPRPKANEHSNETLDEYFVVSTNQSSKMF